MSRDMHSGPYCRLDPRTAAKPGDVSGGVHVPCTTDSREGEGENGSQ
jgi:hypothetical protein